MDPNMLSFAVPIPHQMPTEEIIKPFPLPPIFEDVIQRDFDLIDITIRTGRNPLQHPALWLAKGEPLNVAPIEPCPTINAINPFGLDPALPDPPAIAPQPC